MRKFCQTGFAWLFFATVLATSVSVHAQGITANFTISQDTGCAPLTETLTNTSTGPNKPHVLNWNLGNGNHTGATLPYAYYPNPGTYSITLSVQDANHYIDSITKTIVVLPQPKATYSATVTECGVVSFVANKASSSKTAITSYMWAGTGSPGYEPLHINGQNGIYQYGDAGNYTYMLNITGTNGCSNTYRDSLKIIQHVKVLLPKDTLICAYTAFQVKAIPVGYNRSYDIYWGNPYMQSDSILIAPDHDTEIVASITDATGCTGYDTMMVKTLRSPKPLKWHLKQICYGSTDTIGVASAPDVQYIWTLPIFPYGTDSNIATIIDPTINLVCDLTQTDTMTGCSITDSVLVNINPLPQINLGNDTTVCLGDSVQIGDSIGPDDVDYSWAETGTRVVFPAENLIYARPISDTVVGYILNEKSLLTGCTNADTVYVRGENRSVAQFRVLDTVLESGDTLHILDSSTHALNYYWDFGDGQSSTSKNPAHLYLKAGRYKITLTVTNAGNLCGDTVSHWATLKNNSAIEQAALSQMDGLTVYPNPFQNAFDIGYSLAKPTTVQIYLEDLGGRQIAVLAQGMQMPGHYQLDINSGAYHLVPGLYMVRIVTGDTAIARQVVKM